MDDFSHVSICFSLPRSRSQWLCWLYGHVIDAWHDPLKNCRSIDELRGAIASRGTDKLFIADTSAILFHDAFLAALPGAKHFYVARNPKEVAVSVLRQTGLVDRYVLGAMSSRLMSPQIAEGVTGGWSGYAALNFSAQAWHYTITGQVAPESYPEMCRRVIDMPLAEQFLTGDITAFRQLYKTREVGR